MIYYKCPKCGEAMNSPDPLAGQMVECLKCGLPITVPGPGQTASPAAALRVGLLVLLRGTAFLTALLGILMLGVSFVKTQWQSVAVGVLLLLGSVAWLALEAIIRELHNIHSELSILNASRTQEPVDAHSPQDQNAGK